MEKRKAGRMRERGCDWKWKRGRGMRVRGWDGKEEGWENEGEGRGWIVMLVNFGCLTIYSS